MPRIFIVIPILFMTLTCWGQTTLPEKKVTLSVNEMTFEQVAGTLHNDHHVNVVYAPERMRLERKTISFHVLEMPLIELIEMLCKHFGLTFQFFRDSVVLSPRALKDIETTGTIAQKPTALSPERKEAISSLPAVNGNIGDVPLIASLIKDKWKDSVVFISIEKIYRTVRVSKAGNPVPIIRKRHVFNHFLSVYTAADLHEYRFAALPDPNQNYSAPTTFGYGMMYSVQSGEKLRIGIGAIYSTKEFAYHRNFKILVPDDPVSIPNTTMLRANYLEVPFSLAYSIFTMPGFMVSISGGLNAVFLSSKLETTEYLTQGEPNTNYFKDKTDSFLGGSILGFRVSKKIYQNLGLFCEPTYVKYFNPLNTAVMSEGADLMRVNLGLTVLLNKTK